MQSYLKLSSTASDVNAFLPIYTRIRMNTTYKGLRQGKIIYLMKRADIGRCSFSDIQGKDAFPWNLVSSDEDLYRAITSDKDLREFGGCEECGVGCPMKDKDRRMKYERDVHVHHIRAKELNNAKGILVIVRYDLKTELVCERPKRVEKALNQ